MSYHCSHLFSYLHGMYAFGLEETNLYMEAEKYALKGLELNKNDAWATHALAHVFEMTGQQNKGIETMLKTEADWSVCTFMPLIDIGFGLILHRMLRLKNCFMILLSLHSSFSKIEREGSM